MLRGLSDIKGVRNIHSSGAGRASGSSPVHLHMLQKRRELLEKEYDSVEKRRASIKMRLDEISKKIEAMGGQYTEGISCERSKGESTEKKWKKMKLKY